MFTRRASGWFASLPFLLLASLLVSAPAWAQFDTAQVSGAIQDSTGGALPGVDVVLVAAGHGQERRAVTNESGLYTFPNVPVGDYRLNATLSGFKPVASKPDEFGARIKLEMEKWGKVVRDAKLRIE